MDIYDLEEAFGGADVTTDAMRAAIADWFACYYDEESSQDTDTCQRVAYTVVGKLIKAVFGEYSAATEGAVAQRLLPELDRVREEAVQLALVGGEAYLRPVPGKTGLYFNLIPRDRLLIFARDHRGIPTDVGCAARTAQGKFYYTLLERRTVDENGMLTVQNRLFRSTGADKLGVEVSLKTLPAYADLAPRYTFPQPVNSVGLIRLKTPMLNCVDGSADGVSVYAAAMGLIRAVNENEAQLRGEFQRGQSRIVVSRDLLDRDKKLTDHLFVGLDEDPEQVGIHIFSPQLRQQSFIQRKQEYLRNIESVVGLKRGMLCDANELERTATEIAASAGDFNLTVLGFQKMWQQALEEALNLGCLFSGLYGLGSQETAVVTVDWGNGVLYDEDAQWESYRQMVADGLLKPEVALGWRFGMPWETPEQLAAIRQRYMPEEQNG